MHTLSVSYQFSVILCNIFDFVGSTNVKKKTKTLSIASKKLFGLLTVEDEDVKEIGIEDRSIFVFFVSPFRHLPRG